MQYSRIIPALICAGALSACNGTTTSTSLSEYEGQAGLALINAAAMLLRGGLGDGISVAVFDTGGTFAHTDLDANYSANQYFIAGYGAADDGHGHGTHVAGIIAGEMNDSEMHGVAPSATIVSYKILNDSGSGTLLTDSSLAAAVDTMAATGVMIINNSWGSSSAVTSISAAMFQALYPTSLASFRAYDVAGGVQVWAAGNNYSTQPSMRAGLPYLFSDLEDGWLAVMAVDLDGAEPAYTNRCGVAADWCLAAPGGSDDQSTGGVYSTYNDGGYTRLSGTSMAAPHVAGAMAALKSLFPTLTYKEIRTRILTTADSSGIYADTSIFGQGLLDLDSASEPIGGLSIAASSSDTGTVLSTTGAGISLPVGALAAGAEDTAVLLLDGFQQAPFLTSLGAFTTTTSSYLSTTYDLALNSGDPDWELSEFGLAATITDSGYQVGAVNSGNAVFGFGQGQQLMTGFARMAGSKLPHNDYRMAFNTLGMAVGIESDVGKVYVSAAAGNRADGEVTGGFGVSGWSPSSLMSLSLVPTGDGGTIGLSYASDLQKPSGWGGSGAFGLSGSALSLGYAKNIKMADGLTLGLSGRLAHISMDDNPLVQLSDSVVASAGVDLTMQLSGKTTLVASYGMEMPISNTQGSLQLGTAINSNGQIGITSVAVNQSDLLKFTSASLSLQHSFSEYANLSASISLVQDGFGFTDGVAGLGFKLLF